MKVDVIHTTVGSREVYEDGRVVYNSAPYNDGWCYKDDKAWNVNGICYIPEAEFECGEHREFCSELGYTKDEIISHVREALEDTGLPFSEDFLHKMARVVYDEAEWETIGVVIDRIDWEEELNEFNMKED